MNRAAIELEAEVTRLGYSECKDAIVAMQSAKARHIENGGRDLPVFNQQLRRWVAK